MPADEQPPPTNGPEPAAPAAPEPVAAELAAPEAAVSEPGTPLPDAATLPPVPDAASLPPEPAPEPAAPELPETDPAFDTPEEWRRVSPKYVVVEVVGSILSLVVGLAVLIALAVLVHWTWAWWVAGALAVGSIVSIVLEPRRVRSIGYRLRRDDLVFRRGIMFQRQVAVPYGRMQLIDITRSPVARWLGLAELKFVTAAASTAVVLPGLPLADAEALRDELVALAETRRAGL